MKWSDVALDFGMVGPVSIKMPLWYVMKWSEAAQDFGMVGPVSIKMPLRYVMKLGLKSSLGDEVLSGGIRN